MCNSGNPGRRCHEGPVDWRYRNPDTLFLQIVSGDPEVRIGQLLNALLRNIRYLSAIGLHAEGMSVMFMGASTGCNTVYGSTPPSNPHPYHHGIGR